MKNVVRMCTNVVRGPEISVYIHSSAQGPANFARILTEVR